MSKVFDVYLLSQKTGCLTFSDVDKLSFVYDEEYVSNAVVGTPILSVSMPIQKEQYGDKATYIFLSNLFPEGDIREIIDSILKSNTDSLDRIVTAMGGDVAGAIEMYPQGYVRAKSVIADSAVALPETKISALINEIESNPFHILDDDKQPVRRTRMSLAGAQPKLPVVALKEGPTTKILDALDRPSTHIIKPPRQDGKFKCLVFNEYICMKAAQNSGLTVANVELLDFTNSAENEDTALLVERYDRQVDGINANRIHQEDLCQITSMLPINKYEMNTETGFPGYKVGPGVKELFSVIRTKTKTPIVDIQECGYRILFNIICGNDDAHAKNFSFLHLSDGTLALTPAYDLVSTQLYSSLEHLMAMNFGTVREVDKITRSDLDLFFKDAELTGRPLIKLYLKFCDRALAAILNEVQLVLATDDINVESDIRLIGQLSAIATKNHKQLVSALKDYASPRNK